MTVVKKEAGGDQEERQLLSVVWGPGIGCTTGCKLAFWTRAAACLAAPLVCIKCMHTRLYLSDSVSTMFMPC